MFNANEITKVIMVSETITSSTRLELVMLIVTRQMLTTLESIVL